MIRALFSGSRSTPKPLSLHPLSVEEALKRTLQAEPEHDSTKKQGGDTTKKGR